LIDQERATQIASKWLTENPARGRDGVLELCLLDDFTRELDFGWLFFYTSRLYRDTGDSQYALAGNAPLIVDRRDGTLHTTGTAHPIEHYIDRYRRERPV
jgi:Immunity protein 35